MKNKMVVFFLKVTAAFLSFIMTVVITRNYEAELAGDFFMLFSIVLTVSSFSRLGLDYDLIKIRTYRNNLATTFTANLSVILCSTLIVIICLYVISNVFFQGNENIITWFDTIQFVLFPTTFLFVLSYFFQGVGSPKLFILGSNILIPGLFILFYVLLGNSNVLSDILSLSIWISFLIIGSIFLFQFKCKLIQPVKTGDLINVIRNSRNLFYVLICTVIMDYGLVIMLGFISLKEEVAYFSLAFRMTLLIGFILTTYNAIYLSKYSEMFKDNKMKELATLIKFNSKQMLFLALPILIFLFVFSESIIFYINKDYIVAHESLKILLLAQLFHVYTGPSGMILMMTNLEKKNKKAQLLSVLVLLIFGIILINNYGALGASYAYLICILVSKSITNYYMYKSLGFTAISSFLRISTKNAV